MYEPEFTVITPTYNIVDNNQADDFTLLVSLLGKQTYPYIEHIIIDNNSQDGTVDFLKEYKNSGYISFFSEPDRGKFDAMNKGILRAKGKYIGFLSCDDFYHDITGIADIINVMEEENADFCFFPSYCIQPDGTAFQFIPSMLNVFQVAPCPRQAIIFKRAALEKMSFFDEKFKLMADYDLIIRCILAGLKGVMFDGNIVTYKMGEQIMKHSVQSEAECNHIFYKNYKTMYQMTNEVLERMVKYSEIPKPLLDKLVLKFPQEDREMFYDRYQQMYEMRIQAVRNMREQERRR